MRMHTDYPYADERRRCAFTDAQPFGNAISIFVGQGGFIAARGMIRRRGDPEPAKAPDHLNRRCYKQPGSMIGQRRANSYVFLNHR